MHETHDRVVSGGLHDHVEVERITATFKRCDRRRITGVRVDLAETTSLRRVSFLQDLVDFLCRCQYRLDSFEVELIPKVIDGRKIVGRLDRDRDRVLHRIKLDRHDLIRNRSGRRNGREGLVGDLPVPQRHFFDARLSSQGRSDVGLLDVAEIDQNLADFSSGIFLLGCEGLVDLLTGDLAEFDENATELASFQLIGADLGHTRRRSCGWSGVDPNGPFPEGLNAGSNGQPSSESPTRNLRFCKLPNRAHVRLMEMDRTVP